MEASPPFQPHQTPTPTGLHLLRMHSAILQSWINTILMPRYRLRRVTAGHEFFHGPEFKPLMLWKPTSSSAERAPIPPAAAPAAFTAAAITLFNNSKSASPRLCSP